MLSSAAVLAFLISLIAYEPVRAIIAHCALENKVVLRSVVSCRKQATNALPVVDTANRLTEERCD